MPRLIWVFAGRTLILFVLSCRGSIINFICVPEPVTIAQVALLVVLREYQFLGVGAFDGVLWLSFYGSVRVGGPYVHVALMQKPSAAKPLGPLKPNFMLSLYGLEELKFIQMIMVMWPRWPPCPYIVPTLKKSSSPKPTDRLSLNLVHNIGDSGPTKFVQMKKR